VPPGAERIQVALEYICSQPSTLSRGVDSYGNGLIGAINWNTCLLYPDGFSVHGIALDLSLKLPPGWRYASALPAREQQSDVVHFETQSFHDVVDSPLICGANFRSIRLENGLCPAWLHLTSASASALNLDDELIRKYERMFDEAKAMFGTAPFDEYHFLVVCSDDFPSTGLEHLRSSFNGVGERDLLDEEQIEGWVGYLLPHEFVHA